MEKPTAANSPNESGQAKDSGPHRLDFDSIVKRVMSCPVVSESELDERDEREKLQKRDGLLRELMAGAGKRVSGCRFNNFQVKTKYQQQVVDVLCEWVDTFPERKKNGDGIVLYGPVGTGKDHLAFSAVGRVVWDHCVSAKWVNGRELVGTIRDRITDELNEGSFIRSMETPAILVISDPLPPIGDLSQHQADMLYRICEARYASQKITVATLNVATDEEADRRLGCATWDRLCHGAWKISCPWDTNRVPSRDVRPPS